MIILKMNEENNTLQKEAGIKEVCFSVNELISQLEEKWQGVLECWAEKHGYIKVSQHPHEALEALEEQAPEVLREAGYRQIYHEDRDWGGFDELDNLTLYGIEGYINLDWLRKHLIAWAEIRG